MNKDMCVACDDGILNIRVGAIIMKDGKILMVGNDRDYLYSVGGRVKFGETAEEAVVRDAPFFLPSAACRPCPESACPVRPAFPSSA